VAAVFYDPSQVIPVQVSRYDEQVRLDRRQTNRPRRRHGSEERRRCKILGLGHVAAQIQ